MRVVGGERATGQRGGGLFPMIKFVRWICFWHPEASGVVKEVKNLIHPAKDIPYLVWERTGISILLYNTWVWARGTYKCYKMLDVAPNRPDEAINGQNIQIIHRRVVNSHEQAICGFIAPTGLVYLHIFQ